MPEVVIQKKIFLCQKHFEAQTQWVNLIGGAKYHEEPLCDECRAGNPVKEPSLFERVKFNRLAQGANNSSVNNQE